MAEDGWQRPEPVPVPEQPNLRPDGRDLGPESNTLSQLSGLLYRVGLSALAQPRLTKGGQPYHGYLRWRGKGR
jgi:hypothetical protein